jgi:hypothetical protein
MASEIGEINETTSLEERHYWCTVLIEQGWDEDSAMEVTGLGVRIDASRGTKECYIRNLNPNQPPKGMKFS